MLGTQTWDGRMEGADESTELWQRPLFKFKFYFHSFQKHLHFMFKGVKARIFRVEGEQTDPCGHTISTIWYY